ncbi:MAG TPA: hypothetical protein VGX76_12920 [Pirellulales bacterium]|jgi:hypothetical protein|nr:hypothetical protein [Pirellulales bacterium]
MRYLYGVKRGKPPKLVATFDSQQQLLAYVRWATLKKDENGLYKFEQGSSLVGYDAFEESTSPKTDDDPAVVEHNPTPSML